MSQQNKNKRAFSKTLLIQESILIWIMTLAFLYLAYLCIDTQFSASLPWLAAMVSFPWAAYGVSQVMYYRKAQAENTQGGITYESAFTQANNAADVLTIDKLDGKTAVTNEAKKAYNEAVNTINNITDDLGFNETKNATKIDDTYESGTLINNFPELNNQTVDYSNLNPDPEGPI